MHVEAFELGLSAARAALRLSKDRGLCWLDGEAEHAEGRWSFLASEPVERVERTLDDAAPLAAFDQREAETLARRAPESLAGLSLAEVPRWAGFVAYDAAWAGKPRRLPRVPQARVLSFARYDAWLSISHSGRRAFLVGADGGACARRRHRVARGRVPPPPPPAGPLTASDPEQHLRAIEDALQHIAAGDFYQVNLARSFRAAFSGEPLALFLALREASPVALGSYLDAGGLCVASRSMERFLRLQRDSGSLTTRPIKGTAWRDALGAHDAREAAALRADDKERAEHAMIVDLMRNDLGRVAQVGSVAVPEVLVVEPYRGLHHLVSTVQCRVRPDVGLRAVLEATFPPGSVTGTPKLAAIEHIERLELSARGLYTGALGFVDQRGGVSLAVAIRTAVVERGELYYGSGGGIVEASNPTRELAETELKAQALREALATLASTLPNALDSTLAVEPKLR